MNKVVRKVPLHWAEGALRNGSHAAHSLGRAGGGGWLIESPSAPHGDVRRGKVWWGRVWFKPSLPFPCTATWQKDQDLNILILLSEAQPGPSLDLSTVKHLDLMSVLGLWGQSPLINIGYTFQKKSIQKYINLVLILESNSCAHLVWAGCLCMEEKHHWNKTHTC